MTRNAIKTGRPKKLSETDVRAVVACAQRQCMTARKIVVQTALHLSMRIVQRVLQRHPQMKWQKTMPGLSLTKTF